MSKITITKDQYGNGRDTVLIEDAKIFTRHNNFSGQYNFNPNDNKRTVSVILDDEDAIRYLQDNGWYIKPVEFNGETINILKLVVSYRFFVPDISSQDPASGNVTHYTEETIHMLDNFRRDDGFEHVDLMFKGTPWNNQNGSGITGYIHWMQVVPHYNEVEQTMERLRFAEQASDDIQVPF